MLLLLRRSLGLRVAATALSDSFICGPSLQTNIHCPHAASRAAATQAKGASGTPSAAASALAPRQDLALPLVEGTVWAEPKPCLASDDGLGDLHPGMTVEEVRLLGEGQVLSSDCPCLPCCYQFTGGGTRPGAA